MFTEVTIITEKLDKGTLSPWEILINVKETKTEKNKINAFYRVPSEIEEIPVIIVAISFQCSYLVVNLISCGLLHKPLGSVSFCEQRHSFGN